MIEVSERYLEIMSPFIQPTNMSLYGLGHHEAKVIESVEITPVTEKTSPQQDLYVVENIKIPKRTENS